MASLASGSHAHARGPSFRAARPSLLAIVALFGVGVLYAVVFAQDVMVHVQGDGQYTYMWARSLAYDGDLDLTNDYAMCGDQWHLAPPKEPGLRPQNTWPVGPALLWAPALLIARAVGVGGAEHACYGAKAEVAMAITCIAGWLTIVLAFIVARRRTGEGPALLGALAIGLATALPYYSAILPSYSHAPSAFAVALFLERWDATRGSLTLKRWLMLGVLLGVVVLMRPQDAVVAFAPLSEWLALAAPALRWRRLRDLARLIALGIVFVGFGAVVFFPQMYAWKMSYGAWLAVPQGPFYMRWEHPFIDGFLFGSSNGLLSWTPVLYLAFIGLAIGLWRREYRALALPLVLMVAAGVYVNAAVWDYWGAVGFAGRRITDMALPFAVGTAITLERLFVFAEKRPRNFAAMAVACVLAVAAAWNGAAMRGVARNTLATYREAPMPTFWRATFDILVDAVYPRVGNPFALPGSAPLAVRYQTTPDRFDVLRGMGVFYEEFQTREVRAVEASADLTGERGDMYCADGFAEEAERVQGTLARATTAPRARMLLPFFADDVGAVTLRWSGGDARPPRSAHTSDVHVVPTPVVQPVPQPLAPTRPPRDRRGVDGGVRDAGATDAGARDAGTPDAARIVVAAPPPEPTTARIRVLWNGIDVGSYDAPPSGFVTTRITLPLGVVRVGVNEVILEVTRGPVYVERLTALK